MRLRLIFNAALGVALLAACAALYAWNPAVALLSLGFALAGFAVARLLRPVGSTDGAARSLDSTRAPEAATPNVAAAVAAGEVPAAALLDVTMDSMREAVVVIDSAMRVVALNNSARDVFRSEGASALSPRRLSDLTRNPAIYSAFAAAVARGERAEVKVETARAGERRVYDLHVAPLRQRELVYGSDVRGAVGVFFDITRLERLERVRQEFLSNVSHELRTPLTAIITFVETLEGGAVDEPETARRFLSAVLRNAERMRGLINDILELSAIESGAVAVEPAPVCLSSLARTAARRQSAPRSAKARPSPSSFPSGPNLNASRQLRDYLSVLLLGEGAHRLGAHAAVRGCGQNHARHRLVVGRFGDGDGVVLPHHDVKRLQLAAHLPEEFSCGVEPRRTQLQVLDSELCPAEQRDVCRHAFSLLVLKVNGRRGAFFRTPHGDRCGPLISQTPKASQGVSTRASDDAARSRVRAFCLAW